MLLEFKLFYFKLSGKTSEVCLNECDVLIPRCAAELADSYEVTYTVRRN